MCIFKNKDKILVLLLVVHHVSWGSVGHCIFKGRKKGGLCSWSFCAFLLKNKHVPNDALSPTGKACSMYFVTHFNLLSSALAVGLLALALVANGYSVGSSFSSWRFDGRNETEIRTILANGKSFKYAKPSPMWHPSGSFGLQLPLFPTSIMTTWTFWNGEDRIKCGKNCLFQWILKQNTG